MPCTLEPWEVEHEEKRANKRKFGLDMTDERVTEYVACEMLKTFEALVRRTPEIGDDYPLSLIAKRWWAEHKKRDAARVKKEPKRVWRVPFVMGGWYKGKVVQFGSVDGLDHWGKIVGYEKDGNGVNSITVIEEIKMKEKKSGK